MGNLFLQQLSEDPAFYVCVLFTIVFSVTLHELGHVGAALKQGDETPRLLGHVTLDPLVHMGLRSLVFAAVVGIAWGLTPVQPAHFKSRRGEALVALAGPAVNLLLAALALTALGLWLRATDAESFSLARGERSNLVLFLFVFGSSNLLLFLLNMLPIPPLDGATVLGDFVPAFRRLRFVPELQPWFLTALLAAVFVLPIHRGAADLAVAYLRLLR